MSSPVGTRGPDYEMVVERGKIAEFAAAMQSQNPAYAGPKNMSSRKARRPYSMLTRPARCSTPSTSARSPGCAIAL